MRRCDAVTSGKPQDPRLKTQDPRPKTQDVPDPDHPKAARADHEILDVIRFRWSPRAFDPTRDLGVDDLLRLFEAARWAPSSRNEQPWRFLVLEREAKPESWRALLDTLTAANQSWAAAAPVLVLSAVRTSFEDTG